MTTILVWLQRPCPVVDATDYCAFEMVQETEITLSPSKLELNPFHSKQEMVHFVMSMYLQHPQQLCNLGMPLQKSNFKVAEMIYHFGFVP